MAGPEASLRERLLATFAVEAAEHLASLRAHLLELSGRELVETTFRELHTLKGAARSVGRRDVERVCAAGEALLSAHSRAGTVPAPDVVALLEEAVAAVAAQLAGTPAPVSVVERLEREARAAASPPPAAGDAVSPPAAPSPRPDSAGSPHAAAGSPPAATPAPSPRPDRAGSLPAATPAPSPRPDTIRVATADLDELLRRGEELLALKLTADTWVANAEGLQERLRHTAAEPEARALVTGLQRDRRALAGAVDGLIEQARRVRMLPAASALDALGPMARDLARAQGKRVRWSATGGETPVDRRVLEAIKDPLIHMVRNAVDHGLERPEERGGKPAEGTIAVTVELRERGRLHIALSDDGRGIDRADVRRATGEDELAALFRSGVSTSAAVTDMSGHGLGLAIVKEQVERLGGSVDLESVPTAGTTVHITVPQTIATFRGLLVHAGGQRFLLPLEAVERVVAADHADAVELATILGLTPGSGDWRACVIVATQDGRAALVVDDVLGDHEVLVKELEPPLIHVRHVAAAGLLGAGELVLILRPADLIQAESPPEPPWVLVVDDADTTRAMERGLLELAGYRVRVAEDGEEAWTALQNGHFDLVVSDVDMPRLNGLELTERIRADAALAELPVVLVSALDDEPRGLAAGANAYVVKSSFEQSNLLEIIRRLGVG